MPYNTRRKSLSLPSLGIHLPNTSRSHKSPSAARSASATEFIQPPSKKVKRSHSNSSAGSEEPDVKIESEVAAQVQQVRAEAYRHTPPPSPGASDGVKVDTEGINDDIVVAVIEQLEKTGNRPHLIKELALVLASTSESVANSANAAALLSSRLSAYLKRPWSAIAPCPLGKDTIPVHPRKVFFYLTHSPRQSLPEGSDDILPASLTKQVTPSLSDPSVDEDEMDRGRMSPSPEIDLSPPSFDDDEDEGSDSCSGPSTPPSGSFSNRSSIGHDGSEARLLSHNHRAISPPLEGDEREFTQTASSVRERGMSLEDSIKPSTEVDLPELTVEETPEVLHNRDAMKLFGRKHELAPGSPYVKTQELQLDAKAVMVDTFMLAPAAMDAASPIDAEMTYSSWNIENPENIELDELDDMLGF